MTPAARVQAAVEVLDRWLSGAPVEQLLTNWGRASRYAGSGDRQAVRDLVFDAVRCRRSFAALGGAETGRGLMIGLLRAAGQDPDALFSGQGHGPAPLTDAERAAGREPEGAEALDCPDWLEGPLRVSLQDGFGPVMRALRQRAPVFLRVNTARIDRPSAQARLLADGIASEPHPLAETALMVTGNARRVAASSAYAEGLVELQDAASQAVVQALPLRDGMSALDYCAGGGGKTLAMAARARLRLSAHDADAGRMSGLPGRAERAGARIAILDTASARRAAPYDLVLADVPCSGSGAWRRSPEGKWLLTPARLKDLTAIQAAIMDEAAPLVRPGGCLAYATCSLLAEENAAQTAAFLLRHPDFAAGTELRFTPLDGGDGFYLSLLGRAG